MHKCKYINNHKTGNYIVSSLFLRIYEKKHVSLQFEIVLAMEIHFEKKYLSDLYYTAKTTDRKYRFQPDIIKRFIRTIDILEKVESTEDLYRFHALNYEVLVGNMKGLESVRVGDKYRIIFKSEKVSSNTVLTICNIIELTNHYK